MIAYTAVAQALQPILKCVKRPCFAIQARLLIRVFLVGRCRYRTLLPADVRVRTPSFALLEQATHTEPISSQQAGAPPTVHTAATLFQKLCYENKDNLSAGIIVAGWDKEVGPSVYNIPLGGGLFRQPWAIGGLCQAICDAVSVIS